MSTLINFQNKKVLVTGGTRGIGRSVADTFRELGASVVATGKKDLDLSNMDSIDSFCDTIEGVDICINNAGINYIDSFCDVRDENWNEIIQVNLTGAYKISKAVAEGMMGRQYGRIINVGSIWGNISKIGRAAYSSSKSGLKGLTLAMAAELAQHNVLVNMVSPGFTRTDLTEKILGDDGIQEIQKEIPIGRLAFPQDIANVIVFLASDLNTYISGQDLVVDGGFINV
jgi:3-oxoacyl-[acyl-carrier protein] reductase